jgi:hypothetical protein
VALFAAYECWMSIQRREYGMAALFGGLAAALVFHIARSRDNSATPEIDRSAIRKVTFKPASPGATRAYFRSALHPVRERPHQEETIMLPGSLRRCRRGGEGPAIMQREGLLNA